MSKFTDPLKGPAAPSRAVPTSHRGRVHVGCYLPPPWRGSSASSRRRMAAPCNPSSSETMLQARRTGAAA